MSVYGLRPPLFYRGGASRLRGSLTGTGSLVGFLACVVLKLVLGPYHML